MPWEGQWSAEHNVAHALAGSHRVLFVDPPLSPATPFRYGLTPASRQQLSDIIDRRVRKSGRLQVFTPLALPPLTNPRAWRASLPLVRAQVRRAVAQTEMEGSIVVACRSLSEMAGAARETFRVGMIMDHQPSGASLLGRDRAHLEREVAATCEAADLLCVPSTPLQALLTERGWAAQLLPWGFAGDLTEAYDSATEPSEYTTLPRPILGYTGSIDDRLDFELLVKLADRFKEGSVVFVGPVSPRLSAAARAALHSRPNLHLLGRRPRVQLPAYISYLDCALLPYADMEFTRYQSPLKMWDYMYAGPPIVGAGSADLGRFNPPIMHFAETPDAAPDLIAKAIATGAAGASERRAFALANTWDARATQLNEIVDNALAAAARPLQAA